MRMTLPPAGKAARTFRAFGIVLCLAATALLLLASSLPAQPPATQPPPTVVFMTDFGILDDSVALCKGVMYGITPKLRIVDLTHQVNAYSIRDGARFLFGASPYFPAGTVFLAVVDPGAGTPRKAVGLKSHPPQLFPPPPTALTTFLPS